MANPRNDLLSMMAAAIFPRTREESFDKFICIDCGEDCKNLEGVDIKEYRLSALCPNCFDRICPEE